MAIAATRGFGTMVPNALVDRIGKSALQHGLVVAVLAVSARPAAIRRRVGDPDCDRAAVALLWLFALVRGVEGGAAGQPATDSGLAAVQGVLGVHRAARPHRRVPGDDLWVGTLMVGSLMDTAHASMYTASTRYLVAGSVVNMAIIQVIGPSSPSS